MVSVMALVMMTVVVRIVLDMMPIMVVMHFVVMTMPISADFSYDQDDEYNHANPDNPIEVAPIIHFRIL